MMPHNPWGPIRAAATLHFDASIPNFALQEYNVPPEGYPRDLCPVMPELEGNRYRLPTAPGLGIEFDATAVANHPLVRRENPRWVRRDGGSTNF